MPFSKTSSGVRESSICCFGVLCFQHVSSVLLPAHTAFPATSSASLFLLPRIMDYCCASQSGRWQSCFSSLEFSFLATCEHTKHLVCACVQQVGMEDAQHWLRDGTALCGVQGAASCTSGACWLQHPWKAKPFPVAHSWERASFLNHWLLTAKKGTDNNIQPQIHEKAAEVSLACPCIPSSQKNQMTIYSIYNLNRPKIETCTHKLFFWKVSNSLFLLVTSTALL